MAESGDCLRALVSFKLFGLVERSQRIEDDIHLAFHHEIQLMQRQADAVIRDAVLREVVGADFFAAVARAHLGAALGAHRRLLLRQFQLIKTRSQHAFCLGAVLDLGFFVLAGDDQAGRQMGDAHGRIGGVHGLAAWTRGAERIDANILCLDLDFDFVGFGQHRHRNGGCVDPALLLSHRNALHAMHAAFVLELAVDLVAADQRDDFFEPAHGRFAAGRDFKLPALRFAVARVHAENLGREQGCLIAAGAGANFEHDVLLVVRIFGQQQNFELVFDLALFGLELRHFLLGHGPEFGVRLLKHGTGLLEAVLHLLPLAVFGDSFLNVAARPGDLAVLVAVANHGQIVHLAGQLVKALLELYELRNELHDRLSDDQLSSLGLFERHSAFQRADGHFRLVVGRRLGGDALQPQARSRHGSQHGAAPLGCEADQLITHSRDDRQQHDSRQQLGQEAIERDEGVENDGNDNYDKQEAGTAALVERGKPLSVRYRDRLAGFEIENHSVFRAMKLKDPVNVFHQRERVHEQQEDQQSDDAIGQVEGDAAAENRIYAFQLGDQEQGNELVHENEHAE